MEIAASLERLGIGGDTREAAGHILNWLRRAEDEGIDSAAGSREIPFTVKLIEGDMNLYLSGTIDLLVDREGKGRWLIDFKYARKKDVASYETQLRLYALALRRIDGRAPERLSIVYLKESEPIADVECSDTDLDNLQDRIFKRINQEWRAAVSAVALGW